MVISGATEGGVSGIWTSPLNRVYGYTADTAQNYFKVFFILTSI